MKKRVLALTLAGLMALSLAACGSSAAEAPAEEEVVEEEAAEAEPAEEEAPAEPEAEPEEEPAEEAEADTLEDATVTIFIAASLGKAFEDEGKLLDMYKELRPNITVEVNSGSSGDLEQQIEAGAPCDLFFSAGKKQVKAAEEAGYVIDGSIVNLLENKVVLVKRAGDTESAVTGFGDMTNAASMALCADSVPAGQYARTIFETMGITDDILNNPNLVINECDKVTAALAAVAQGSNEIGIVYASDAANEPGVEVIAEATAEELPENPLYPVCLIDNHSADDATKAAAADLQQFLQSEEALDVFAEYTFLLHEE